MGDLRQHLAAVAGAVDRLGDPADGENEAVVIDARLQLVVAATGHGGHVAGDDKPGTALAESAIDRDALIGHNALPPGIFRGSAAYETILEPQIANAAGREDAPFPGGGQGTQPSTGEDTQPGTGAQTQKCSASGPP